MAANAQSEMGHYAELNGLRTYYEVHGEGPPLLVLHGGLCALPVWPQPIAAFAKRYRVIAPEQMGHGRTSDKLSEPMNYHAMANRTAALLRHLQIKQAYVLGWSDGGVVGLDLAIHHPELVAKLAVSGANFSPAPSDKPGASQMTADDIPSFIREPYERLSPDGPSHWPMVFERMKEMWRTQPNFSPTQLSAIKARTLIVAGDRDTVAPSYTVELWRSIPDAELWIAPNTGHGLPLERAEEFNRIVAAFFRR